jgi:hypothetical protein
MGARAEDPGKGSELRSQAMKGQKTKARIRPLSDTVMLRVCDVDSCDGVFELADRR